jgi:glutathione S-transferase
MHGGVAPGDDLACAATVVVAVGADVYAALVPANRSPQEVHSMITLYGFGRIFPEGHGETKDLWVQWALEETGLPYRVHALDHTGGELDGDAYRRISPFRQAPVIDDDGFVVAESAAIALYLAEKSGQLIPGDVQGRTRVVQWCFAAVATVGTTLVCMDLIGMFDSDKAAPRLHAELPQLAGRWLGELDRHLQGRDWLAGTGFTVADLMMASVLRGIRHSDLLAPHPRVQAFYERCRARPAFERALALYAQRLGVRIEDIR